MYTFVIYFYKHISFQSGTSSVYHVSWIQ